MRLASVSRRSQAVSTLDIGSAPRGRAARDAGGFDGVDLALRREGDGLDAAEVGNAVSWADGVWRRAMRSG
ncbi:hypothetical protein CS062_07515 [Roseateles chitinivorans]|uniref:Uncharacterized protein n=1 Tax=Roseateles chitinivorans TaxID=2917965 RepID=A0A2G9CBJ3_9BURK|nr:hypothetical protein CS062_07515 [Roseateles chitinivorans]